MRARRRLTSRLIVMLSVAVTGSLVAAAAAPALDLEPFVNFIDHGLAPKVDTVDAAAIDGETKLPDHFGSVDSELTADQRMLGFDPEHAAPTPTEIRNDDWGLWSELGHTAIQVSNGDTTASNGTTMSPPQILLANLSSCLETHIPGVSYSQVFSLANALAYQNEVRFVQSQSGMSPLAASSWLQQNGLTFDPSTWINWLNFSAKGVPRAS
jgi:hypothetical protein